MLSIAGNIYYCDVIIDYDLEDIFDNKSVLIKQAMNIYKQLFNELNNFDVEKEYGDIYKNLRDCIDIKYLNYFTNILDITARIIIHEIYLANDNISKINIEFEPIKKASSNNRKHFEVAKEIAIKTIKMYYLNRESKKKIMNYIDDFLPSNYIKNKDINKVVWYFLVCIMSYNQKVTN